MRALAIHCRVLALSGLLATAPTAQSPIGTWLPPAGVERFGSQVEAAGDVDGDGVPDAWVGGRSTTNPTSTVLVIISGADGSPLHVLADPAEGTFAPRFDSVQDIDLDGFVDLLLADRFATDPNAPGTTGVVTVLSGADGTTLHTLTGPPGVVYGSDVAGLDDLDGDGAGDVLVGAPEGGPTFPGGDDHAYVVSGASGSLLHDLAVILPGGTYHSPFGSGVAGVGDTDGDGVRDFLVAGNLHCEWVSTNYVHLYSGADASLRHVFSGGCDGFGLAFADAGDVDGDGCDDLILGDDLLLTFDPGPGKARVHSGRTGALLHEVEGFGALQLASQVDGAGDLDHDGHADFAVNGPHAVAGGSAFVRAFSGRTGEPLLTAGSPPGNLDGFAPGFAFLGDVDGDGLGDFAVGASLDDTAGPNTGRVDLFSGPLGWSDIGQGLAGAAGTPQLVVDGRLQAGTPQTVVLSGGPASGETYFVLGTSLAAQPFFGGVLVPAPDMVSGPFPLDAAGDMSWPVVFPAGVPARSLLYLQAWMPDPMAIEGLAATNAVSGAVPASPATR